MQFKDIKEGYSISVLDKQEFKFSECKIQSVTPPHYDMNAKNINQQVVDIVIDYNGTKKTFTIPDSLSVAYAGNFVLAINKEDLSNEVNSMVNQAKQHFSMNGYMQKIIDTAPSLLSEMSPVYREKLETEKRFSDIENAVKGIQDTINKFISEFKS